jgi:hypothetical protein
MYFAVLCEGNCKNWGLSLSKNLSQRAVLLRQKFKKGSFWKFGHPYHEGQLFKVTLVNRQYIEICEMRETYENMYDLKEDHDLDILKKYIALSSLEVELL